MTAINITATLPLETARRAYDGISFSPERRGDSEVTEFNQRLQSLAAHIEKLAAGDPRKEEIAQAVFNDLQAKYREKYLAYLGAKSRCMSSMITGPARFPTRRAEKANDSERKRCDELLEFSRKMDSYAAKALERVIPKEEKAEDELAAMRRKLANAEKLQEFMKTANALYRKGDMEALAAHFVASFDGGAEKGNTALQKFLTPSYTGRIEFEGWQLSNNLANIKRMRGRVAEMEAKAQKAVSCPVETAPSDDLPAGLEIVRNHAEDRLQLIFKGKPDEATRTLLKRHGFRWSPRFTAWQRQLTGNAEFTLKHYVLPALTTQQGA